MSKLENKRNQSKRLVRLASSTALMGAIIGIGGLAGQANAGSYAVIGSGVEVREALSSLNAMEKPAELACGAKEVKTKKETKATEAKCGEGKCGATEQKTKQATAKEAKAEKAMKNATMNKASSKVGEMKCGEGKCGASMKKADAQKTAKDVKKSAVKTVKETKKKTTEVKSGK